MVRSQSDPITQKAHLVSSFTRPGIGHAKEKLNNSYPAVTLSFTRCRPVLTRLSDPLPQFRVFVAQIWNVYKFHKLKMALAAAVPCDRSAVTFTETSTSGDLCYRQLVSLPFVHNLGSFFCLRVSPLSVSTEGNRTLRTHPTQGWCCSLDDKWFSQTMGSVTINTPLQIGH